MRASARAPTAMRLSGTPVVRRAGAVEAIGRSYARPVPTPPARPTPRRRYAPRAVAEFLSDAWITELDRAARAAPGLAALGTPARLVVEECVRHEGRDVVYHFVFESTGARVERGPASHADLSLVTDAATAWGLGTGTVGAQEAIVSGNLKIRGRAERLRAAGEALHAVHDVFEHVRDATTAPDDRAGDAGERR